MKEIQLNKKILFRKSIQEAYQKLFGRKPALEYENKMLKRMIDEDEMDNTDNETIH